MWGLDRWGSMLWGSSAVAAAVPALGALGLCALALGLMALGALVLRPLGLGRAAGFLAVLCAFLAGGVALAVPNTFVNGSVANATAVNANFANLEGRLASLEGRLPILEFKLAPLSRSSGTFGSGTELTLTGVNLNVRSGGNSGVGNLTLGDNSLRAGDSAQVVRTGSGYLVVGNGHRYTGSNGIVAGIDNEAAAPNASILGGSTNVLSAQAVGSMIVGGSLNSVRGRGNVLVGGTENRIETGREVVVLGGFQVQWLDFVEGATLLGGGGYVVGDGASGNGFIEGF